MWSGSLKRQVDKERARWWGGGGGQAEEGWCEHSKHCVNKRCFYKVLTSLLQLENFTPSKAQLFCFLHSELPLASPFLLPCPGTPPPGSLPGLQQNPLVACCCGHCRGRWTPSMSGLMTPHTPQESMTSLIYVAEVSGE